MALPSQTLLKTPAPYTQMARAMSHIECLSFILYSLSYSVVVAEYGLRHGIKSHWHWNERSLYSEVV